MASLADLLTARRERKRELLEELRPLQQDVADEEIQQLAYAEALRRERVGVEARLARLRQERPDRRAWLASEKQEGEEPPTAAERVAAAEARLEAIDAELERVDG